MEINTNFHSNIIIILEKNRTKWIWAWDGTCGRDNAKRAPYHLRNVSPTNISDNLGEIDTIWNIILMTVA